MTINISPAHSFIVDGVTTNVYHANKREGIPFHSHRHDHTTTCMAGSCVLRKRDKELVVNKFSQPVNLIAPAEHEIEALEDGTVFANTFGALVTGPNDPNYKAVEAVEEIR